MPFPPHSGKRLRTYNIVTRLAQRHRIVYLCYGTSEEDRERAQLLARRFGLRFVLVEDTRDPKRTICYFLRVFLNLFSPRPFSSVHHFKKPYASSLQRVLAQEEFDLAVCEWTFLAGYFSAQVTVPTVLMAHNVERHLWERFAECNRNPIKRAFGQLQARKVRRFEAELCPRFDHCVAVSEGDCRTLISDYCLKSVSVTENGVDLDYFKPCDLPSDPNQLVFTGAMDYFANEDAVRFFVRKIFPIVQKANPRATFSIVGRNPSKRLFSLASSHLGVEVSGTVPDVRGHIASSGVYVVPLRIGGGTRLKILEAMAMGKAVVSTTVGAEGLEVHHGRDVILADTPREFARAILGLQTDADRRKAIGENARQKVEARYGWDAIVDRLEATLLTVAANKGRLPGTLGLAGQDGGRRGGDKL